MYSYSHGSEKFDLELVLVFSGWVFVEAMTLGRRMRIAYLCRVTSLPPWRMSGRGWECRPPSRRRRSHAEDKPN